jgi:hypothetical protein
VNYSGRSMLKSFKFEDYLDWAFCCTQMSSDNVEMREMAARICRDYLRGSWRKITARDIVLKRIR